MSREIDLWIAPRAELVAIIERQQQQNRELRGVVDQLVAKLEAERQQHVKRETEQQAAIDALTARVRTLERKTGSGESGGGAMPGTKPTEAPTPEPEAPKKVRKQRAQGVGWQAPEPTETVDHAVEACPDCGITLIGGSLKRRRIVVEIPEVQVRVIEHRYWERICPGCNRRQVPGPELEGVVDGEQRFGVRAISLISVLREELRLPIRQIQRWLELVYGLHISTGAIVAATQRVAKRGAGAITTITAQVRGSPALHLDETGWRENGRNRYLWIMTSPTGMVFRAGSREGVMVDRLLGDAVEGVLVSDFYVGYHHYAGRKQRCWAHLLRDVHALAVGYPNDVVLQRWASDVHTCYREAVAEPHAATEHDRIDRMRAYEDRLLRLCAPFWEHPPADRPATDEVADPNAALPVCRHDPASDPPATTDQTPTDDAPVPPVPPQRTLCDRIARHIDELFVFVADPAVPPDNNAAERGLRHLVTARKISGGSRSERGTETKVALATLFGSWRLQHRNPVSACLQLLGKSLHF